MGKVWKEREKGGPEAELPPKYPRILGYTGSGPNMATSCVQEMTWE